MKSTVILAIVTIVAALATVGIVSAISSATEAQAVSSKNEPGCACHRCSSFGQGAFASDFKCCHFAKEDRSESEDYQSLFSS
jgi:curli biogenesis system outer membrane secretion channel CsgG